MSRLLTAAGIGGCLALLCGVGAAASQAARGAMADMPGHMGGGGVVGGGLGSMSSAIPGVATPRYDARAEYAKAIAALKASQFKDAVRAAAHVTQVAPDNPGGWRLLAVASAGDNDWKGSRRAYQRAVKLAPDDMTVHVGLGLAMARLGDARAQAELDWLRARASVCGDTCPDAANLQSYAASLESAMRAPAATAASPG